MQEQLFNDFAWVPRAEAPTLLPIIHFKLLEDEFHQDAPIVAGSHRYALQQALFNSGFFYLEGHGIEERVLRHHYDTTRLFLAWPLEKKRAYQSEKPVHGYTSLAQESTARALCIGDYPDLCEKYSWRVDGDNPCPTEAFRATWTLYFDVQTKLAHALLKVIESVLSLAPEQKLLFNQAIEGEGLLRYLHYPHRDGEMNPPLAMAPHHDIGLITLSYQIPAPSGFSPLQVEINHQFIAVPSIRDTLVVNVGETLSYLSQGQIKASTHKVLSPPLACHGLSNERTSIPFFFDPNPHVVLQPTEGTDFSAYYADNAKQVYKDLLSTVFERFNAYPRHRDNVHHDNDE